MKKADMRGANSQCKINALGLLPSLPTSLPTAGTSRKALSAAPIRKKRQVPNPLSTVLDSKKL